MAGQKAGTVSATLSECLSCKELPEFGAKAAGEVREALAGRTQREAAKELGIPFRSFQDLLKRHPYLKVNQ